MQIRHGFCQLPDDVRPVYIHHLIHDPAVGLIIAHNRLDVVAECPQQRIARQFLAERAFTVVPIAPVECLDELRLEVAAAKYFDGVAVNNEYYTQIKCGGDAATAAERSAFLDGLYNTTRNAGILPVHMSLALHWGQCNGAD